MNSIEFWCRDCKIWTDAGYRWAYWSLEHPGIVVDGARVDVARVLAAAPYWDSDAAWLRALLPFVRTFLVEHADHELAFGDVELVLPIDEDVPDMDWLEVGPRARSTLRSLIAQIPVPTWDEVCILVGSQPDLAPWWWGTLPEHDARCAFDRLLKTYFARG